MNSSIINFYYVPIIKDSINYCKKKKKIPNSKILNLDFIYCSFCWVRIDVIMIVQCLAKFFSSQFSCFGCNNLNLFLGWLNLEIFFCDFNDSNLI